MNRFLVRMAAALVAATLGLSMTFYALERLSLVNLAESIGKGDGHTPVAVPLSLFVGLLLSNAAALAALVWWSRFVRSHRGVRQAPVWVLVVGILVGGTGTLWALATHSQWLRAQADPPVHVHWGYILFQVMCWLVVLASLVFVAARWAPGYKGGPVAEERG